MNTAEQIIAEAHKKYSDLKVDLNWKPIDSMDDRKAFLYSLKYGVGITLEKGSCFCDLHKGEKIFIIAGYMYVRDYLYSICNWSSPYGHWQPVSHFEGSEKEARDAVLEFCYKLDTRTDILHAGLNFFPTTCRMDDSKAAEFDSDVEYFRNWWANRKEVVS